MTFSSDNQTPMLNTSLKMKNFSKAYIGDESDENDQYDLNGFIRNDRTGIFKE